MNRILIATESRNGVICDTVYKVLAMAQQFENPIDMVVFGECNTDMVSPYVDSVMICDMDIITTESCALTLHPIIRQYSHIVCADTHFGKSLIPRLAIQFNCQPISSITEVISSKKFNRISQSGNIISTITSADAIIFTTVRISSFSNKPLNITTGKARITSIPPVIYPHSIVISEIENDISLIDLSSAKFVIAGGRGIKSTENFQNLINLGSSVNAGVGATRVLIEMGYADNASQIGLSGISIAPDLYIAFGVSGAIQHLSGIKDSGTIISVNTDSECPMSQNADYIYQADAEETINILLNTFRKEK